MPNQPKTPSHGLRVAEDLWAAVSAAAKRNDETVADVARRAFVAYVKKQQSPRTEDTMRGQPTWMRGEHDRG